MEIISNIALISINETVFVQLISFLIFLFIMNRIMFKPLRRVVGDREDHIVRIQKDIDDAEKQMTQFSRQLDEQRDAVRAEAFAQTRLLESKGKEEAHEILEGARKEVAAFREKAEQEMGKKVSEARKFVQQESETLAVKIMEKILDRRLAP